MGLLFRWVTGVLCVVVGSLGGLVFVTGEVFALNGYVAAGAFGSKGSGNGQFSEPVGVAVNDSLAGAAAGDVYVVDKGNLRVERFSSSGVYLSQFNGGGTPSKSFSSPEWVAVDNSGESVLEDPAVEDVYVADSGHGVVDRFTAAGVYAGQLKGTCAKAGEAPPCAGSKLVAFGELLGVTVAATGALWVYEAFEEAGEHKGRLDEFSDTGVFVKSFTVGPPPHPGGLAIDSAGTIYASGGEVDRVVKYSSLTGEQVEPEINSTITQGVTSLALAPTSSNLLVDVASRLDLYGPFGEPAGEPLESTPGLSESDGVAVGASGRAFASQRGAGNVEIFNYAPLPPLLEGEASTTVTATEAKLVARLTSRGETAGYFVEYGVSDAYGSRTPEVSAGAAKTPVAVPAQLAGLQPGVAYHFRFVARNAAGTSFGVDAGFTTLPSSAGVAALPDGRAYELVSGVGEPGEVYLPKGPETTTINKQDVVTDLPFLAAADGNSVVYVGDPSEAGGNGEASRGNGNELAATRDRERHRWDVSDLTPTPREEEIESPNPSYQGFSGDLQLGVLVAPARGLASPGAEGPAGCNVLYARSPGGYRGLFTETQTPGFCGLAEPEPSEESQKLQFAGANTGAEGVAANSQLLFQSPAALSAGTVEAPKGEGNNLYDAVAGQLHLVNILPGETTGDPHAVFGGPPRAPFTTPDFSNVISGDGSHVFWTDLVTHRLYVRENPLSSTATTLQLDVKQQGAAGESGGGLYWSASSDGSKVFFTDCNQLTANATAVASKGCEHQTEEGSAVENHRLLTGNDLYEYDFAAPAGQRLTDLSRDTNTGDPLGADVQGVIGASQDGAYVYFVAGGALAAGAEQRTCREAVEESLEKEAKGEAIPKGEATRLNGEQEQEERGHLPAGRGCNVYLKHTGEAPKLIATLAAKDNNFYRGLSSTKVRLGDWAGELGVRTAEVTPSGRQLVLQSTQQLTGYNNSLLTEGNGSRLEERAAEVFVYDATSGRLVCASCDPRNAPPTSELQGGSGTYLPSSVTATSLRRWISQDGSRVFFDSSQPLVPQDTNHTQDVYEWEREGSGGCPTATSVSGGCVFLLSGGDSPDTSYLIDADSTGENVFFTHRGSLGQIITAEGKVNVLDARINGGFPEPSLACTGTGCQGVPPAPPTFAVPPSATFAGTGNYAPQPLARKAKPETRAQKLARALKACRRKHNKHKRHVCEQQARKHYSPRKA